MGLHIASVEAANSVDLYDLGRGDFQLMVFDKTGERIATETMRGHDLTLPSPATAEHKRLPLRGETRTSLS